MNSNFLKILQSFNFKQKNNDFYYYVTPIVLSQTSRLLVVYCFKKDDKVFLCDNSQLIDAYDAPNINTKAIDKKTSMVVKTLKMGYKDGCIYKKINYKNFATEFSEFIKSLVLIEHQLNNL